MDFIWLCAAIIFIFIAAFCVVDHILRNIYRKYETFIFDHSVAVQKLININQKYIFNVCSNFDMEHSYDNENFYNEISPKDYLTYQLVYIQKDILKTMEDTLKNRQLYSEYVREVALSCQMDHYDMEIPFKNRKKLTRIETAIFDEILQKPLTELSVKVSLYLTTLNGSYRDSKEAYFFEVDIQNILEKLNQKHGAFYLDSEIWQSICRVERGKVSNKMRFSIYQRDGYRCRKCGRQTNDLEIDHIYPISKGGKTTYDNLQTLCHRCNYLKSNHVEFSTDLKYCSQCGAKLILKKGKNGSFYGCSAYPNCKFTKSL